MRAARQTRSVSNSTAQMYCQYLKNVLDKPLGIAIAELETTDILNSYLLLRVGPRVMNSPSFLNKVLLSSF